MYYYCHADERMSCAHEKERGRGRATKRKCDERREVQSSAQEENEKGQENEWTEERARAHANAHVPPTPGKPNTQVVAAVNTR